MGSMRSPIRPRRLASPAGVLLDQGPRSAQPVADGRRAPLAGPPGGALPGEAEGVEQPADMVPVLPDPPAPADEGGHPGRRPRGRLEPVGPGPLLQEGWELNEPSPRELGRPAAGAAVADGRPPRSFHAGRPAVDRLATDHVFPSHLGLGHPLPKGAACGPAASIQCCAVPQWAEGIPICSAKPGDSMSAGRSLNQPLHRLLAMFAVVRHFERRYRGRAHMENVSKRNAKSPNPSLRHVGSYRAH